MCLAAPSRVVAVGDDETACVECFGQQRTVSLMLLDEPVAVGDYLLVQVGGFAFERLDAARALEALATMRQLVDTQADQRQWGVRPWD
jgi:hydrogenase expression/formation protein HypC